jgi:hypothetical protein
MFDTLAHERIPTIFEITTLVVETHVMSFAAPGRFSGGFYRLHFGPAMRAFRFFFHVKHLLYYIFRARFHCRRGSHSNHRLFDGCRGKSLVYICICVLVNCFARNLPAETGGKPETTKVKEMWASGIFSWNSP